MSYDGERGGAIVRSRGAGGRVDGPQDSLDDGDGGDGERCRVSDGLNWMRVMCGGAGCVSCVVGMVVWGVAAERPRGSDHVQGRRTGTWKRGCELWG